MAQRVTVIIPSMVQASVTGVVRVYVSGNRYSLILTDGTELRATVKGIDGSDYLTLVQRVQAEIAKAN